MPADTENSVSAAAGRSMARGGIPEALRRRYFQDERAGPGVAFYVDATGRTPAFRDRGGALVAASNDPNAIRDMVAIAKHRGWSAVIIRGDDAFRREAWLAGRSAGLDVRGYRPTERDLQDLERRARTQGRPRNEARTDRPLGDAAARSRLDIVDAVVRARVASPSAQARIIAAARERVADWLERGATFAPLSIIREAERAAERRRTR